MSVTSGFFDAVNSDRTYTADQMSTYFEGLISNGVYASIGNKMRVTAGEGMSVMVGTGRAVVSSHWVKNDSALSLSLDAASTQYNRVDAIVIRYDAAARSVTIVVRKGTETAGEPGVPIPIHSVSVYELLLASVTVMKNTTAITQSMITDYRTSAFCGYVTGLINQVDTSTLFSQWQAAYEQYYAQSTAAFDAYMAAKQSEFNTWFAALTSDLRVDTTLHSYQNTETVTGAVSEIYVGIADYAAGDILSAYINGVLLVEGTDYTISGTRETAKIVLTKTLSGTNTVTFIVLKSVVGENSGGFTVGSATAQVSAAPVGIFGNAEREDV